MIQVNGLKKAFDGFVALNGVDMHVEKGAIYGLVGPNGAGKSTLIRHLTGVYRPDQGEVQIDGENVYENVNWISPIFVIPKFQNKGIASNVIERLFDIYPKTIEWRLDTIKQEKRNCYLYEKCGFVRTGDEKVINENMTLIM